VGYLQRKAANSQPKRKNVVAVNKDERIWRSEDKTFTSDTEIQSLEFARFWSCFDPIFPHCDVLEW
jgi:accessory colonization factor AcfC